MFIGSRANYSSLKSVIHSVHQNPNLLLQLVVGASAVLDRYGKVIDLIQRDGFSVDYSFYNMVEGENPTTMAKSTGLGIIELSMIFDNLKPDFVVIVGDRFEMMSVTLAAAYMNIRIAHTMGGEVSGTIDESIRHAITKFAHVHFPSNSDAADRIIKMGEDEEFVFNVGCPRIDLVKETLENNDSDYWNSQFENVKGVGNKPDFNKDFLLVSQHPVTTEFGSGRKQIEETLKALQQLKIPSLILWPNIDAGSDDISKGIRTFREKYNPEWMFAVRNLPTELYIHLMSKTRCLIGNSSSGIREGAFIGTPVVNIGTRQSGRNSGNNIINVDYSTDSVKSGILKQLSNGRYEQNQIYGAGDAGNQISKILEYIDPPVQKKITY